MTTMSQSPARKYRTALDDIRYDLLCGLMASTPLPAVDEAIFRCLLFSGDGDIRKTHVRRSLPSLAEAIGRDIAEGIGKSDAESKGAAEKSNRQVQQAHQRLRADGGLFRAVRLNNAREGKGRGYAFHHTMTGRFEGRTEPNTPLAFWAAKSMAIQVSPIGPSLEQTWNRVWWHLGSDNARTQPLNEWAEALGLSRATALRRLRELGRSDVGMTFEELPPEPREIGQIGRNPKRFRITAELPPRGKLPDGAKRHRARQQREEEMLRELAPATREQAGVQYMEGPDGVMVPAPVVEEGPPEDLPDFDAVEAPAEDQPRAADEDGGDVAAEVSSEAASEVLTSDVSTVPGDEELVDVPEVEGVSGVAVSRGEAEAEAEAETEPEPVETPAEVEASDDETPELSPAAEKVRTHLNKRLHDAAEANAAGDHVRSAEILRPVLAAIPTHIAPALFSGDEAVARRGIVEAFKRGQERVGGAVRRTPDDWAVDYLPESSKPHAAHLALDGEPAPAAAAGPGSSRLTRKAAPVVTDEAMDRVSLPTGRVANYGYEDLPEGVGAGPVEAPLEVTKASDTPTDPEAYEITAGASQVVASPSGEAAPEVVGVQLTLDGSHGRELASGEATYPKRRPARKLKAKAAPATVLTPEVLEAMRVVGVVLDKAETASLAA
jgi:hypothetical protein